MSAYHVYEMFKGRLVASFHTSQEALDLAHEEAATVPDDAGMVVVTCRAVRTPPQTIGDVAELVAKGYGVLWRVS